MTTLSSMAAASGPASVVDWRPLVAFYLDQFLEFSGISSEDVDRTEYWAANATAFSATGSWRAKIVGGKLFIKTIRMHAHWAERASVLRMLLLALADGGIPDVDLIYAHADNDPTPPPRRCARQKRRGRPCEPTRRLPLFTNSRDPKSGGIPVPEFTWVGWGAAEPWCIQQRRLDEAADAAPWSGRDRRLFFSGGLDNGHHRKALRALSLAERAAGRTTELRIRDVGSRFHRWGQFDRDQPSALRSALNTSAAKAVEALKAGGASRERALTRMTRDIERLHVRPVAATAACSHQFSLNIPGFGYSSRLRSLLRCGGAVIDVKHSSYEFYMPLLKDNEHIFVLSGGKEPVRDALLPLLRSLHSNISHAHAVADAGRRFARSHLSFDAVIGYFRALLIGYAEMRKRGDGGRAQHKWTDAELSAAGYTRVGTEAELQELMGLCDRCSAGRRATPPKSCFAKENALPACTLWAPKGGGRCFDARCCKGFDCATRSLGCS